MAIRVDKFVSYSVAPDGSRVQLDLVNDLGTACQIEVPLPCFSDLALTVPKIMMAALAAAYGGSTQRLVHNVKDWTVERAAKEGFFIFTFTTPDDFTISFTLHEQELWDVVSGITGNDYVEYPPPPEVH